MTRRDINFVLAGGVLGWLATVLVLSLFPVPGERWNIVGLAMVAYPFLFLLLAWAFDRLYEQRAKRRASAAASDA